MDFIQNLIVNHPKSNDNCEDVDLILESGDYIQVTAETADKITVTLTAQEYMDEN